jgi:hypothetical protein
MRVSIQPTRHAKLLARLAVLGAFPGCHLPAGRNAKNGAERFRFEVQSFTPHELAAGDLKLFQPPPGYFEIEPLPF